MMQKIFTVLLAGWLIVSSPAYAQPEQIKILSYHNHPPFVTGEQQGLTYQLAEQLNQRAAGQYLFLVKMVPRSRLNHYLKPWIAGDCPARDCDQDWIVPWVNPKWGFIKGERDNYLWHELLKDANVIVSRSDQDWHYLMPESLKGKVLGGMRGHRYVGIDELVSNGEIKRIDGNRERDNLLKVLHRRVDATLLPESTMNYLLKNDPDISERAPELAVSAQKHQSYTRYMMMPESRSDLSRLISLVELDALPALTGKK